MNSSNILSRLQTLQAALPPETAWLLSNPTDMRYYANFDCLVASEREAFLVITATSATLIHAAFSPVIEVPESITKRTGAFPSRLPEHITAIRQATTFKKLLIDETDCTYQEFKYLSGIENLTVTSLNREKIINQQAVKDQVEQKNIKKAIQITTQMFEWIKQVLKPGMSEQDVATLLYQKMLELGADITPAFPFIIAFGENTALAHHQPSGKLLELEMPVLIDMGARYNHYCSDMTRTFWFGQNPSPQFTKVENIVMSAYRAAATVVLGTTLVNPPMALDVDTAARKIITEAGYEKEFNHTTGHGLGLSIHEQPSLSWRNTSKLQPGMAVTVEPGIYLVGKFGYRYENTLFVSNST